MANTKNKKSASVSVIGRHTGSGRFVGVRGANALKDAQLVLTPGLDLTKPIAEQVQKTTGRGPGKTSAGG